MNLGRGKVFYPVSGNNQRLVCSLIAIGIQNLCTLKMCEDLREAIAQRIGRNLVQNCSHLHIAWYGLYPIDALQVAIFHARPLLEIEQGRAFERKLGKRAFERIAERVLAIASSVVGYVGELRAQVAHEHIEVQRCRVF